MTTTIENDSEEKALLLTKAAIWTTNFTLLCFANIALFMSIQVLLPTLPVYLISIGGSQQDIGYAMGAFTICAMFMRPLAGRLVDTYGRKKILTLGLIMIFAVSGLYRLSTLPIMIIVTRGLHGLGFGIVGTAIATIVADSLPYTRLAEGMGYFGLTTSLSMAVAPIIGFGLADNYGYRALFLWVFGMSLATLLLSVPVKGTSIPSRTPNQPSTKIWSNLLEKSSMPASGVMFLLATAYGAVLSFIAIYASESGMENIALFFTAMAIFMFISRPISGRWSDQGGTDKVISIGLLAILLGVAIISLSHTMEGFLIAGSVFGFGMGFCMPTLQARSVRYAPAHRRGAATGTFFIAFDLGIGLGTIIWGYVAAASSYQTMYFITMIPIALAGAVYYKLRS